MISILLRVLGFTTVNPRKAPLPGNPVVPKSSSAYTKETIEETKKRIESRKYSFIFDLFLC